MSTMPMPEAAPFPVPRKRGRPRDTTADDRILEAAASLMLERGFDNMTVDDVAAAARAGKATVYRRWASKEDLAVAALELLYREELPVHDTGSVVEDLRAHFTHILEFANSETGAPYLRMTMSEALRDPRVSALHAQATATREAVLRSLLERGVARGELRKDVNLDYVVTWMGGMLAQSIVLGRQLPSSDEVDEMLDFVLDGIRK